MQYIILLPILLMSIIIHEISHGFAAYLLGDDTAKRMGRLSLNPMNHIDRFGTVLLPIILLVTSGGKFSFGYAKPVPINPYNFKNQKKDTAITSIAGPLSNIAIAILFAIIFRILFSLLGNGLIAGEFFQGITVEILKLTRTVIVINLALALFNMIPWPPLDGSKIFGALLPDEYYYKMMNFHQKGMYIFFGILMLSHLFNLNIIGRIIYPPLNFLLKILIGI